MEKKTLLPGEIVYVTGDSKQTGHWFDVGEKVKVIKASLKTFGKYRCESVESGEQWWVMIQDLSENSSLDDPVFKAGEFVFVTGDQADWHHKFKTGEKVKIIEIFAGWSAESSPSSVTYSCENAEGAKWWVKPVDLSKTDPTQRYYFDGTPVEKVVL